MKARFDREQLRRVPMANALSDAELDALVVSLRAKALEAGEALCRQGDFGDTMVIVFEGRLDARVDRADGSEFALVQAGPGEVLGEMACIDPAPRAATLVAVEPTVVGELSRDALQALRRSAPGAYTTILGAVIGDVTRRLRDVERRIDELTAPPPRSPSRSPSRSSNDGESKSSFRRFIDRLRGVA